MENEKKAQATTRAAKHPGTGRVFRSDKVLIPLSLFLAIWVWLILVVGSSEQETRAIAKIPVSVDFSGTVSERLGLEAFWPQNVNPEKLTVDVTIRGRKYDISPAVVSAADLLVELLPKDINGSDVNSAGDYQLRVQVGKRNERQNYEIVEISPSTFQVYFDHPKTATFLLEPAPIGVIAAASEDYYAGAPLLTRRTVSVSGPAKDVNSIQEVRAQFLVPGPLEATQTFNDVEINPVIEFGAVSPYLKIDTGASAISVTVPVWKRAELTVSADFMDQPSAYITEPLPVEYTPETIRAALPEESIQADGSYSVGQISFHRLSPADNVFRFPAEGLKEIHFFSEVEEFYARVDMTGMAEARLTLPASAIHVAGGSAALSDVKNVVVVGPEASVAALTDGALRGELVITDDTPRGSVNLPVSVALKDIDDCWIYAPAEYLAACVVQ